MNTQTTRRSTTQGLEESTQEESDDTVNRWSPNNEPPTTEDVKARINETKEEGIKKRKRSRPLYQVSIEDTCIHEVGNEVNRTSE